MFNRIKKKFEDELKQSPLRLSASVQQLAQAISPSPSVNSLSDAKVPEGAVTSLPNALNVSADLFSISDDHVIGEGGRMLHNIDLTANSPSMMSTRSRRDSFSSVASDASSLFPSFHQSEWESDVGETSTNQLEKVSKEELYQGYKKLLYRYNKYKGRFMDLSRLHKDLQYENIKIKNVLQENQDITSRKMTELREQCQLEQKAKAHIEELLRNDLEEKDHVINTLNTKVDLLRSGSDKVAADKGDDCQLEDGATLPKPSESVLSLQTQNDELAAEVARLKKQLEMTTSLPNGPSHESAGAEQVKEKITQLKSGIVRMKSENENISNLLLKSPATSDAGDDSAPLIDFSSTELDEKDKRIEKLTSLLYKTKEKHIALTSEIQQKKTLIAELSEKTKTMASDLATAKGDNEKLLEEMRKREEASLQTITETKMTIHRELEAKEEQVMKLTQELKESQIKEKELQANNIKLEDLVSRTAEASVPENSSNIVNVRESVIDLHELEEQKKHFEENITTFLNHHQEKYTQVLGLLESKITKAESNLVRLCAGQLICHRETEMELRQKIASMEETVANSGADAYKIEYLEKEVKTLEAAIEEKNKIIKDKEEEVTGVNAELSGKIDRIVVLGAELEEAADKHKLLLETVETKNLSLSKLKSDTDEKIAMLHKNVDSLQSQLNASNQENIKYKELNDLLEKTNNERQVTLAKLEEEIKNNIETLEQLKAGIYCKDSEISEKAVSLERAEENILDLTKKLEEARDSANNLSLQCDELKNMAKEGENKLQNLERENQVLGKEKEQLKAEMKKLMEVVESENYLIKRQNGEIHQNREWLEDKEKEVTNLKKSLAEKTSEIEKLTSSLEALNCEKDNAVGDLAKKLEEITRANDKIANLEKKSLDERKQFEEAVQKIKDEYEIKLEEGVASKAAIEIAAGEKEKIHDQQCQELNLEIEQLMREKERDGSREDVVLQCQQKEEELEVLRKQLKEVESECQRRSEQVEVLEKKGETANLAYEEVEKKLKSTIENSRAERENLISELNLAKEKLTELQVNAEVEAAKLTQESDSKVNILKSEIEFLKEKFEHEVGNMESNREREALEIRTQLEHSKKMATELLNKLEVSAAEKEELSQTCTEKSLKVTELEGCLSELKTHLDRNFNAETSRLSYTEFEEKYEQKLKEIVGDYELKISQRDARISEMDLQLSDNNEALETVQPLRSEVKSLRNQLIEKDEVIERKIEELEFLKKESENKIINSKIDNQDIVEAEAKKFEEVRKTQLAEFETNLKEQQTHWEDVVNKIKEENEVSLKEVREKYEMKIEELEEKIRNAQLEWTTERKSYNDLLSNRSVETVVDVEAHVEDLESTSKIAVAAYGSSTESIDMLRKEIMNQALEIKELKKQHKREILELGKLVSLRSRRLSEREREGEDVEHEYLRNILYEYMMGREQTVLAKVLAAIVKFDQQQIQNILERQHSVGALRLL